MSNFEYQAPRRLLSLPAPVNAPRLPQHELYHINHDEVTNKPSGVVTDRIMYLRWGRLGYSEQREPAIRRIMKRSDAQLMPAFSLSQVRGRVIGRNVDELVNAVDNIVIQTNPRYVSGNFFEPEVVMVERDLSEFVVPVTCHLKLIRHCDVFLDGCKILADVEVQFVVNQYNHLVFGACRVYVEDGPEVNKRIVTLQWTNPTGDKNLWEITDLTLVYGLPVLRKESTVGVCPYCPKVNTARLANWNYSHHLIQHGILSSKLLAPDPVMINNRVSCPICAVVINVKPRQSLFSAYLAHMGCNQMKHRIISNQQGHLPMPGMVEVMDTVEIEDVDTGNCTELSRNHYWLANR